MANSQYLKPQLDTLKKEIDHIVVLMLENRSFDNLLGWLYEDGAPRGQEFEGLNYHIWNPLDNMIPMVILLQNRFLLEKMGKIIK